MPWRLVKVDEREPLPRVDEIAGLGMMGGPMSVNDDLPWIRPMLDLVRSAIAADVPVIGHCLGGQLLARALGAPVTGNPVKEIGWGYIDVARSASAHEWGPTERFLSFHWHGETFAIPHGAQRIWSSAHCDNQAFVVAKHIGIQCHIEMTEAMIERWCATGMAEIEQSRSLSRGVQTPQEMREDLHAKLDALEAVAERVYDRWLQR